MRLPLSGGFPVITPLLLSTKRVRKWGHAYVISLDKQLRKVMNVKEGDDIAFRKIGRYVFVAVVRAYAVAPVSKEEMRQAREALGV